MTGKPHVVLVERKFESPTGTKIMRIMGPEPKNLKLAIVGGGICGLALAAGLCKVPNLDVHVYEAVSEYLDVGAGLALHLNAIKAMASIGDEVRQAYLSKATNMGEEDEEMVTEVLLAQGPHMGELVAELGRAKGRKSVSRADLLAGLMALVPKECVSLNKKLASLHENLSDPRSEVSLQFQDGTHATADCVLGADGIHSTVRKHVLGEGHPAAAPKNHDRWQVYRTLVTVEEARRVINEKWTRNVPILLGPRGHINCIPLNKGKRLSAGVAVRGAALTNGGDAKPLDPSLYKDYSKDAQQIVQLVVSNNNASWTVGDHDHAPWYNLGRVAVIGDAAHASLPFAGNGAAQALEDSAVLYHLFKDLAKDHRFYVWPGIARERIMRALAVYNSIRRPRSQAVVDLARKFGRIYAYAEDGMHEDPQKMKEFFATAASFTNDFDVEEQNKQAIIAFQTM